MPLQELLQIDVDAEGRVRRRRRSWSSASSPQHLKAPGHLLQHHPLGTENNSGTNNNNDDADFLPPPPPAVKDLGIASRSQTLDDYGEDAAPRDLAGNGNASNRARQGQGSTNDNIRLALLRSRGNVPSLAGRTHDEDDHDEEEEDDHDHSEILSNVDVRRDLDDDAYDSDTLRDIDDLLSPQGSALLDHHDVYEEEDDDDDDENDDGGAAGDEASHASNGHGNRQVPGPKDAVFTRRISHLGDVQTDGGHSEAEVKAENVTPSRGRRFDFASTASDDSTVDILNLINVSRQKRSERRRKGLDRMLTPESVSKHLRTRSDTDICGSAEKAARRKAVSTKGWKAFGSRDHPPRLSTLRKVVSSSRSLAATAEASQKALAQRKRRQQLQDQDDLLLDTGAAETPAESTSQVKEKSPSSPTTATTKKLQAWSMVDILRWTLVLTLWAIAIVNPHLIVDLSRAMTGATLSVSAPASSSRADVKPPVELAPVRTPQVDLEEDVPKPSEVDEKTVRSVERKITQQPRADEQPARFVMPTEPARVEFAYPNADGASVPQAGVTLRLKFFHLFPEQLALHRNPRLCMRLSNGGEDTLLGCVPVKDAHMEVSLKSLQLGPTRVVATLVSEAKKLGRAARQMNVVLMDPVPEDRAPHSTTTTTTETTTDNDTQERCVTTCSRTCTMTYEM